MQKPSHDKKDIPPALPQKPGKKEIDVDDAMIEEPKDDAFEKGDQKKPGKGENKAGKDGARSGH